VDIADASRAAGVLTKFGKRSGTREVCRMDGLFTPDFVRHDPRRELHGIEKNRQFIASLRSAFPDLHFTVEDQIAEGEKVAVRYRFESTHRGEFQGMPPTGKQVSYSGILIYLFADDKIAEQWTEIDLLGFLRQLDVLPRS
jgi:steroid delta-isomerase-like uncharacterized protein